MFYLFDDQLIDDVVSRVEQSRVSCNLQTEEFRYLNGNLQNYLNDIKIIDDENRLLQENIEQIRTKNLITLENYLKRLPNDFHEQSQVLTNAHIERYRYKSRTRRYVIEREELKRRIQFIGINEKNQQKYLNILQKQERSKRNEFEKLNEQYQHLIKYVENEKQLHQQSMDKIDNLHIQLEQICIERSKTEFQIQTLKEEVQLMQTTKEFLNDEYETIVSTQIEANEYLLSRLNDSITRIREDFNQLNQTQIQQIENDYKQMLQTFEQNLLLNQTIDTSPSQSQQLQMENQIALDELTILNDDNQILSQRVLAMETDLYSLRNERMQQLITKDNELEHSKIELQTLNEKLNHFAEYDRNLKFELTLYRGVLESEYRRKQTANNNNNNNNQSHLIRPTTLRTNNNTKNSMTDTRTWLTSRTNQNKFYDQQQEEVLKTDNRAQSDYDSLNENTNVQIDDVITTESPSNDEKLISGERLWQQLIEPFNKLQQDDEKPSRSSSTTAHPLISPYEVQKSSSRTSSISTGTRKSPTVSTPPVLRDDQLTSSQNRRLPTPPEHRSPPINTIPFGFEVLQSSSISSSSPQQYQESYEIQQTPSRTTSISAGSEVQRSSTSPTVATAPGEQLTSSQTDPSLTLKEHQPSSRTSSSSKTSSDVQNSFVVVITPIFPHDQPLTSDVQQSSQQEDQPTSRTSSISLKTPSDIQKSPVTATTPTVPQDQPLTSDVYQLSSQEDQLASRTSSISSKTSLDKEKPSLSTFNSTVSENQPLTLDVHQLSPQEEQPTSLTSSVNSKTVFDFQTSPRSAITPIIQQDQPLTSDVHQSYLQEDQPTSRTSSIISQTPSDIQKSPVAVTTSTVPEDQPLTSDVHQSYMQEDQPTSRTSSITSQTLSDIQKSSGVVTTSTVPEDQPLTSDVHQLYLEDNQPSSRSSSISSQTPSNIQKSSAVVTTSTVPEDQPLTSDVHQSYLQEDQPSSRTSSISSKTYDVQNSSLSGITSTLPDAVQLLSTLLEDSQTLSDGEPFFTITTDVHGKMSPIIIDDYQITSSTDDFVNENQSVKSFIETDDNVQYEDSVSYTTDEKALSEVDRNEHSQSFHSSEPLLEDDHEIPLSTKPKESQSSPFDLTSTSQEQKIENLFESYNLEREEYINSSLRNQIEENQSSSNISSTKVNDNTINESNSLLAQDTSKQSSGDTSFTDVEEVDPSTSPKYETKSDENDDPSLAIIMQDLRHVFHEIANHEDLVEINNDLPDKILDRLEFRDHFIRTLFDSLIRKYLVQSARQGNRPETLDWIEFRDILFPIITGRYTERHIRTLFDLFNTSQDGYLSLQEIAELLEILQANDTIDLAQNIIDEFDRDHDGKLSVDELIEAIKNNDDINEHALSEETENQQWFNQSPTENQIITFEVPIVNFPLKIDDKLTKGIPLLGRIFKRLNANFDTKQLDNQNQNLSIQITNEFINNNNINLSSDVLQLFIQLYLDQKQDNDLLINWIEFRDLFLPIVNNGYYRKIDLRRWFEIFDTNQNGVLTREQIIQLLGLVQIENIEEILNKLNEITDDTDSWTFDELIFILDSIDKNASHLLTNIDYQIDSFDNDWLSKNIF